VVVAAVAIALGVVCGSGNCGSSSDESPYKAFETKEELSEAVDLYISSLNVKSSIVARTYGYPIGTWDVSKITNFAQLFDPDRDLAFDFFRYSSNSTFNEDLSGWDVSAATNTWGMFKGAAAFVSSMILGYARASVNCLKQLTASHSILHRTKISLLGISATTKTCLTCFALQSRSTKTYLRGTFRMSRTCMDYLPMLQLSLVGTVLFLRGT
jgi:hypothetical protein